MRGNGPLVVALATAVLSSMAVEPAISHDLALTTWGTVTAAIADPRSLKASPFPMNVEDRFQQRVESGGTNDQTPCSGTRWVYDYAHHIAAGGGGGPEMLLYAGSPPIKVPSRDLSHVSTVRGVRLGSTPEQVVKALNVPLTDITRTSTHREFIYLSKPVYFAGDHYHHEFIDAAMIVFHDGRAISIWFIHGEN
jgi:hypothetical protein